MQFLLIFSRLYCMVSILSSATILEKTERALNNRLIYRLSKKIYLFEIDKYELAYMIEKTLSGLRIRLRRLRRL